MIPYSTRPILLTIPVCLAVVTSACGTSEKRPQSSVPSVAPAQPQLPPSDRNRVQPASEYIQQSASLTLFSIRAAEVALQRASNGNVRSVAQRILNDQTGLSAQLSFAGRRLNQLPSARLLPQHDRMLRELVNSSDFDRSYVTQQRIVANSGYRLHSEYLRSGTSPTLKPVARNALAVISSELEQLRRL